MEIKCSIERILYSFFIVLGIIIKKCPAQDFAYEGHLAPEHWREYYNSCDGKYQSPINIDIHNVRNVTLPPLQMTGFDVSPDIAYIKNNGHTVQVTMDYSKRPTISGGPLNGTYEFVQFHYHWGDNDTHGSEDKINNHAFPIELHIVFYKTKYNNYENALNFPDGVAVLAYFYEISNYKNYFYDELSTLLDNLIYPGNQTKFLNGPMIRELTTNDTEHYFTYTGSLTTPPCSEVVTWIDFETPISISSEQLSKFRHLRDHEGRRLKHNNRPIQPLNGRIIYRNDPNNKHNISGDYDHITQNNFKTNENSDKNDNSNEDDLKLNQNTLKTISSEIFNTNNNNNNNNGNDDMLNDDPHSNNNHDEIYSEINKKYHNNNQQEVGGGGGGGGNSGTINIHLTSSHCLFIIIGFILQIL